MSQFSLSGKLNTGDFVNCASFVWTIFLSLKSRGAKK